MSGSQAINIVRSKRRSIALVVDAQAVLTVRAPHGISLRYIEQLVAKKEHWIREKQAQILSRPHAPYKKEYKEGEIFLITGKPYTFTFSDNHHIEALENKILFPRKFLKDPHHYMVTWYKRIALQVLKERVELYSTKTGLRCSKVKITSATTRWGSCSSSGSINFTWRLVMAQIDAIDYVVVHELAHINEKNHSSRFWSSVESILPDYRVQEKWLKDNQQMFTL